MPDLTGRIAVALILVSNDGQYQLTPSDKAELIGNATQGLMLLDDLEPRADINFLVETHDVVLDDKLVWTNEIAATWPGWPAHWDRVDAVFPRPDGKLYFFRGSEYLRYTPGEGVDDDYPRSTESAWSGWPANWYADGIDAAVNHPNGNFYFFKGDEYLRHVPGEGVDDTYPRKIAATWKNWPAHWSHVDAATQRTDWEGKIQFFRNDELLRYTTGGGDDGGVDSKFPMRIGPANPENGRPGQLLFLPPEFRSGIDAALQTDDGAVYLFKGSRYCRYPGMGKESIEKRWRDPAHAELGIEPGTAGARKYAEQLRRDLGADAAIVTYITSCPVAWVGYAGGGRHVVHDSVRSWGAGDFALVYAHETAHLFGARDEYGRSSCDGRGGSLQVPNRNAAECDGPQLPCLMDGNDDVLCAWSRFQLGWNFGLSRLDAAIEFDPSRAYFFGDRAYTRFSLDGNGQAEPGYPRRTSAIWQRWPSSWTGVDAVVRHPNGKVYFFRGSEYARYTIGEGFDDGYPATISSAWPGWPQDWYASGIDGAVLHPNGNIYFFKGSQYLRHVPEEGVDDQRYPQAIAQNWAGWPSSWSSVNAVLYRSNNDKIYFFRGDEYARFSPGVGVDDGYPKPTRDWWGGLLRY